MPKADPSTRATAHVNLSVALTVVQISLYGGTVADHGITRKEFVVTPGGDHPVGRGQIDKDTGELLAKGTPIVKKILTENGPVYVEDHEIEELFQLTPDTLVIKEFEPEANFHAGHSVPGGLLYLEPRKTGSGKKQGPDPLATRLVGTLLAGMKTRGAVAICELTTRGVPKPAVLMPDGRVWLTYHTDATREQRALPEVPLVASDVAMMDALIETLWSEEPLDFTDERTAVIQAHADKKAAAGEFGQPDEVTLVAAPPPPVADLTALLAASVEAAKAARAA